MNESSFTCAYLTRNAKFSVYYGSSYGLLNGMYTAKYDVTFELQAPHTRKLWKGWD